jgi:hypothetical protein
MSKVYFDYEFIKKLFNYLFNHSLFLEINNSNSQVIQTKIDIFNIIKYYKEIYINKILEKDNQLDLLIIKTSVPKYIDNIEGNLKQGDVYFSIIDSEKIEKFSIENKCLVFNFTNLDEAYVYFSNQTLCIKKYKKKEDLFPVLNQFQNNFIKLQDPYFVINCNEDLIIEKEILSSIFKNTNQLTLVFNEKAIPRLMKMEGVKIDFNPNIYEEKILILKSKVDMIFSNFHNRNIISDYVIISSEYGFNFIEYGDKVTKTQILTFIPIFQFDYSTKKFPFFNLKKEIEIF